MSTTEHIVVRGDTLGSIARRTGASVEDIARANAIADPNRISPGQRLKIPAKSTGSDARADGGGSDEPWSETLLRFIDAIGRPIAGLKVRLVSEGNEVVARTGSDGCAPELRCSKPGSIIDIFVARAAHKGGGEKKVASYQPMAGRQSAKVQSGKHRDKTPLLKHEGSPARPPKTMAADPVGAKERTRTEAGNPLTCLKSCECPNDDDLRLGPNAEFREHVKAAAKRLGVAPQAVAAVMKAEAAKEPNGKWKADSASPNSSATGMTQFLDRSWIDVALRPGTHLNEQARAKGWLSTDAKGHAQFRRANGTTLGAPGLDKKLSALLAGNRSASDANLQALLDLRLDAKCAILTAMDYAKSNLDTLDAKGYDTSGLNDVEKARIIYLCHHLGPGDAVKFIDNTISENTAQRLLTTQVGEKVARKKYLKPKDDKTQDEGWVQGHRAWLTDFVGSHILLTEFTCPGDKLNKYKKQEWDAKLITITESLKGRAK